MTKKEFALNAIRPYYKDSSLCGYEGNRCLYVTSGGNKCVLGKYLLLPEDAYGDAVDVLDGCDQADLLVPEAVGVLSTKEWSLLQEIHDSIAVGRWDYYIRHVVSRLGLFTYEELIVD